MNPGTQPQTLLEFMQQVNTRLAAFEAFMNSFNSGNALPRPVETTIKSRFTTFLRENLIYGSGTLIGGKFDVTDARITSNSIGLAFRYNSSSPVVGRDDLAGGWLSNTNSYRFFEGSFSETYQIVYLIIPMP